MWPFPLMHCTLPYRDFSFDPALSHPNTGSNCTGNPSAYGTSLYWVPLVISGGQDWRPIPTCSLENPLPVLTSDSFWNMYGWQAGGIHPTGMRSCLQMFSQQVLQRKNKWTWRMLRMWSNDMETVAIWHSWLKTVFQRPIHHLKDLITGSSQISMSSRKLNTQRSCRIGLRISAAPTVVKSLPLPASLLIRPRK